MTHRFPLTVRFGDLDPAGIVYYPRYLHMCHVGMEEYFRHVVDLAYPRFVSERLIKVGCRLMLTAKFGLLFFGSFRYA